MNIFVISSVYKNPLNPQANIFVHEQCKALRNRGHKVVVLDAAMVSYKRWNCQYCKSTVERYEDHIKIYSRWTRSYAMSKLARISSFLYFKKINFLWKFAVKKEGKPDVIYAHFSFPAGCNAVKLSQMYNVPVVVMEHGGMYLDERINPYISKILAKTIEKADSFFCVSEAHAKGILKHSKLNREIQVIPNMISSEFKFFPLENNESFIFFSAGNLKRVKRFDLLINSFVMSFNATDNVKLYIAGEGEERKKLDEIISKHNRKKQIILLGRLNKDNILIQYKKCNAFVLTSEHESFGIAYREAGACGRPVISTDNGGINEGWSDELGLIVPRDNKEELSKVLRYMYDNYHMYSPELISEKVLSFCSEKVVVDKIEQILRNVIGENNDK